MHSIMLLGLPGSGKGTQGAKIADTFGFTKISTGDMLRNIANSNLEEGKEISKTLKSGDLVGDEYVENLLFERILKDDCKNGYVLDGFPRTVHQSKMLDKFLKMNNIEPLIALYFMIDPELVVKRQGGRLVAPISGMTYHKELNPPKIEGVCDVSGEKLIQREDDKEEVVRNRLQVYIKNTKPVIDYYKSKNRLIEINAQQGIDNVYNETLSKLKQLRSN